MIDAASGSIAISGVGVLAPRLREDEFLKSRMGLSATPETQNGEHHSYGVGTAQLRANAYFRDGQLWMVVLTYSVPDERGWSNWSENQELERKRIHDQLLEKDLGRPPYAYAWGKIESVYDSKDGASSIVVTYS